MVGVTVVGERGEHCWLHVCHRVQRLRLVLDTDADAWQNPGGEAPNSRACTGKTACPTISVDDYVRMLVFLAIEQA